MPMSEPYCGCCGRELDGNSDLWCKRCAEHVHPDRGVRLWDRTYFAQHGKYCPFQIPPPAPGAGGEKEG